MMFGSREKHAQGVNATFVTVDNEEIGGDTEQHLSHNSHKRQNKINVQASKIATVKAELSKALQENKNMERLLQSGYNGRGHDQSSLCNDCVGTPKNITEHSV